MLTERCEKSDLLVTECAHCRGIDFEEDDANEFYFGAISREAERLTAKKNASNRSR